MPCPLCHTNMSTTDTNTSDGLVCHRYILLCTRICWCIYRAEYRVLVGTSSTVYTALLPTTYSSNHSSTACYKSAVSFAAFGMSGDGVLISCLHNGSRRIYWYKSSLLVLFRFFSPPYNQQPVLPSFAPPVVRRVVYRVSSIVCRRLYHDRMYT